MFSKMGNGMLLGVVLGTVLEGTKIEGYPIATPYGNTSSPIRERGNLRILLRHGADHTYPPHLVPYKANIYALKALGVESIVSICAVGGLRRSFRPGSFCLPNQLIDFTKNRDSSYSGPGSVVHMPMWEPFNLQLRGHLSSILEILKFPHIPKGTYIAVEGPGFSTKAESEMYKKLGGDIIGMTACPEVQLATELGLKYSLLCCITDYNGGSTFSKIKEASKTFDGQIAEILEKLDER